ncbi:hypothetical protein BC826DRAFT_1045767 [Russula brevipes]|nr:hypothetical protein BC826DRAFT_1045767 [Russula brevipes]
MSTQSPPLSRKSTTSSSQGLSSSPREGSPSPSFFERPRNTRPFNGQSSPTASTTSFHQRRTPPLAAQTVPGQIRRATSPLYLSTVTPPPAPIHSTSQQNTIHQVPPQPSHNHSQTNLLQLNPNQMTPSMTFPRPAPRAAPPQFPPLEPFPELIADIDPGHSLGAGMSGVAYAGGASSGPISRSAQFEPGSLPKESTLERVRSSERPSPREPAGGPAAVQRRDTARDKDRETWELDHAPRRRSSVKRDPPPVMPPPQPSPKLDGQRTDSSPYFSAISTPGDHSTSYGQLDRELRSAQVAALPPSPPASRPTVPYMEPLRSTPPSVAKIAVQSPTGQTVKARTPDKSLPVQEEPEEDGTYEQHDTQEQERDRWTPGGSVRHTHRHEQEPRDVERKHHSASSPTPSSDLLPEGFDPYDARHEQHNGRENTGQHLRKNSDEAKQNRDGDEEEDDDVQHSGLTQSQDEESYTPRSPSVTLPPERSLGSRNSPGHLQQRQHVQSQPQPQRIRSRNGVTDALGLRSFDATSFENTLEQLKSPLPTQNHRSYPSPHANSPRQATPLHQIHVHSPSHEEHDHFLDDPAAAYYQGYHPQSPVATHSRPGAPIPPTPHSSNTAAPSPSPLISGMGRANGVKPVLPPYSPVPPVGSPYPHPFGHIRRGQNYPGSYNGTMDVSQMDPNVVHYALNNGGMVSDSTLSPSSTPFPGPQYNPWAFLQTSHVFSGRRGGMQDPTASMHSSPSHQPVALPPHYRSSRGLRYRERSEDLRRRTKIRPPPRVESTQPRDTSPELSSGEETAGESKVGEHRSESHRYAPRHGRWDTSADDEDDEDAADEEEWVDEDVGTEGVADDLLQLEFHTDYVSNLEKRRRRWKVRWEALLHAFHALDRETDTTLVLLAAPSHTGKLHSVASRGIRRDDDLLDSPDMGNMRSAFAEVAARRRASRSTSLLEQLSRASSSPRDGSPSSGSEAREEDLRRALDTAIGSLRALGGLYEQREMRWIEEKHRLDEDKEKVQLLLRQVLGVGVVGNLVETAL